MSKFCIKCGTELPETAKFCNKCGNPCAPAAAAPSAVNTAAAPSAANASSTEKKRKLKIIIGISLAVIFIAAVVLIIIAVSGGDSDGGSSSDKKDKDKDIPGYEEPLEHLFAAVEENDISEIKKTVPDFQIKGTDLYFNGVQYDSVDEYMKVRLDHVIDYLEEEFGEDLSISYTVTDKEEFDDSEIDEAKNQYMQEFGVSEPDLTEGYILSVDATFKSGEKSSSDGTRIAVVKIDGSWYIYGDPFSI